MLEAAPWPLASVAGAQAGRWFRQGLRCSTVPLAALVALVYTPLVMAVPDDWPLKADGGRLESPELREVSGVAAASHQDGWWWMINDSGAAADLFLVDAQGRVRGRFSVKGVENTDWEDLACFSWKGGRHLLVADTGDNSSRRDSCQLHVIREPGAEAVGSGGGELRPEWSLEFRYEDGPRDCEAVAVDARQQKILLMSKRTDPPVVYELPLRPDKPGLLIARRVGTTRVDPPAGSTHPYGGQPTAMDVSPDGSTAVVLTYVGVFLFERQRGEDWARAFARPPELLSPHGLPQAEAVAFSNNGRGLKVVSEGARSPTATYGR